MDDSLKEFSQTGLFPSTGNLDLSSDRDAIVVRTNKQKINRPTMVQNFEDKRRLNRDSRARRSNRVIFHLKIVMKNVKQKSLSPSFTFIEPKTYL